MPHDPILLRRLARGVPARRRCSATPWRPSAPASTASRASDHLQPWWEPGESGHTWVWLGAAGQATERIPLGTGVTATGARYHPALIAQAWMTLERMFPGRPFLGIGSGEALNEVPVGDDWPSTDGPDRPPGRGARLHPPPVGRRDDHRGGPLLPARRTASCTRWPTAGRRSGSRPSARRPPRWPAGTATGCGRCPTPSRRPRSSTPTARRARKAGREGDGEIVFQALVSWAPSDDEALEQARKWKGAQPPDHFTDDWHRPQEMYEHGEARGERRGVRAEHHRRLRPRRRSQDRLRELEQLGGTVITLQNNSGAHAERAIEVLGERGAAGAARRTGVTGPREELHVNSTRRRNRA